MLAVIVPNVDLAFLDKFAIEKARLKGSPKVLELKGRYAVIAHQPASRRAQGSQVNWLTDVVSVWK